MTEQKEEKKKRSLVKRIFKWIGLSILVLLILLALILEAPKKLVILLLIILAAFTALPKPARKWFWLSLGAVVLLLIIWILLPENNEGWQPYQYSFDKELQKLQTQYSIPPEENAAILYNQLMERYDVNDYYIFDLVDTFMIFFSFYICSFLCLPKETNQRKGTPGVIVFRSHGAISREFQTPHPNRRMKFRFGKCLVRPAISHGMGEVERHYKMPCETLNANARKCSQTLCVLCISVSRRVEQEKAFCRAKSFFFFPYFSFGLKS